jgi:hypothetical protein
MRKIILFFIVLLLPVYTYAQPSIVFNAENHDFGTISESKKIEHVFDFTNKGNEELVIERLVPS